MQIREFREMIFLGNGDHSAAQVLKLLDKLREATRLLGGLQQMTFERDTPEYREGRRDLEILAADLYTSLTGVDIAVLLKQDPIYEADDPKYASGSGWVCLYCQKNWPGGERRSFYSARRVEHTEDCPWGSMQRARGLAGVVER